MMKIKCPYCGAENLIEVDTSKNSDRRVVNCDNDSCACDMPFVVFIDIKCEAKKIVGY